jgi:hypothetical protein
MRLLPPLSLIVWLPHFLPDPSKKVRTVCGASHIFWTTPPPRCSQILGLGSQTLKTRHETFSNRSSGFRKEHGAVCVREDLNMYFQVMYAFNIRNALGVVSWRIDGSVRN